MADRDSISMTAGQRKCRWLRRAGVVVGCVLAGAIINVLVAWGCVYWIEVGPQVTEDRQQVDQYHWLNESISTFDYAGFKSSRYTRAGVLQLALEYESPFGNFFVATPDPITDLHELVPVWCSQYAEYWEYQELDWDYEGEVDTEVYRQYSADYEPRETRFTHETIVHAGGFPLLSMWGGMKRPKPGHTFFDNQKPIELDSMCHWSVVISRNQNEFDTPGLLPLIPIWSGFLMNTLFYGAIAWMMFAAPRAARRRMRVKRSQCPACGYPVGTSPVCTECGEELGVTKRRRGERHEG